MPIVPRPIAPNRLILFSLIPIAPILIVLNCPGSDCSELVDSNCSDSDGPDTIAPNYPNSKCPELPRFQCPQIAPIPIFSIPIAPVLIAPNTIIPNYLDSDCPQLPQMRLTRSPCKSIVFFFGSALAGETAKQTITNLTVVKIVVALTLVAKKP